MGTAHLRGLVGRTDEDNVRVTRVCDVYRRRLNRAVGAALLISACGALLGGCQPEDAENASALNTRLLFGSAGQAIAPDGVAGETFLAFCW